MADIARRTIIGLGAAAFGTLVVPRGAQGETAPQVPKLQFEVYKSGSGFRFRLKAANGKIIAASESYKNKADCLHGIDLIKRGAAAAAIEDLAG